MSQENLLGKGTVTFELGLEELVEIQQTEEGKDVAGKGNSVRKSMG